MKRPKPKKSKPITRFTKVKICVDGMIVFVSAVSFHLHIDSIYT